MRRAGRLLNLSQRLLSGSQLRILEASQFSRRFLSSSLSEERAPRRKRSKKNTQVSHPKPLVAREKSPKPVSAPSRESLVEEEDPDDDIFQNRSPFQDGSEESENVGIPLSFDDLAQMSTDDRRQQFLFALANGFLDENGQDSEEMKMMFVEQFRRSFPEDTEAVMNYVRQQFSEDEEILPESGQEEAYFQQPGEGDDEQKPSERRGEEVDFGEFDSFEVGGEKGKKKKTARGPGIWSASREHPFDLESQGKTVEASEQIRVLLEDLREALKSSDKVAEWKLGRLEEEVKQIAGFQANAVQAQLAESGDVRSQLQQVCSSIASLERTITRSTEAQPTYWVEWIATRDSIPKNGDFLRGPSVLAGGIPYYLEIKWEQKEDSKLVDQKLGDGTNREKEDTDDEEEKESDELSTLFHGRSTGPAKMLGIYVVPRDVRDTDRMEAIRATVDVQVNGEGITNAQAVRFEVSANFLKRETRKPMSWGRILDTADCYFLPDQTIRIKFKVRNQTVSYL